MDHDSIGARILAVFIKPTQAMKWIGERPRWVVAMLLSMVIVGAFAAYILPISGPEQMEMMRETRIGRMMPEEDWQRQYDQSLNPTTFKRVVTGLSGGIGLAVVTFIYAALYLLFVKLAGGGATFKQTLGIVFWAGLIPNCLGSLVKLPIVLAKQSVLEASVGLAALAPSADLMSSTYQFLMYFGDFFAWWGLVVTVIGFREVCGFSTGKAAVVIVLPWLILSGLMFGLGRLFI